MVLKPGKGRAHPVNKRFLQATLSIVVLQHQRELFSQMFSIHIKLHQREYNKLTERLTPGCFGLTPGCFGLTPGCFGLTPRCLF